MEISKGGKKSGKNGILIVLAGDVQILQSEEPRSESNKAIQTAEASF